MAKVMFSEKELNLVLTPDFILTKNSIIEKLYLLFGELSVFAVNAMQHCNVTLPAGNPKIAKGEQYMGLPWVMMDYPRGFAEPMFAIRCFFWWGNFFSFSFLTSGHYQSMICNKLSSLNPEGWYVAIAHNPWQHHFDATTYQPLSTFTTEDLSKGAYLKLSKKIPLQSWEYMMPFFEDCYKEISNLLST